MPALPEDGVLSRLLFGTSVANLSAPEALQLAAAAASLRSGGRSAGNPLNKLGRAIGVDRIRVLPGNDQTGQGRSEEHTSELQSLMRISYAVFCLKKKKKKIN